MGWIAYVVLCLNRFGSCMTSFVGLLVHGLLFLALFDDARRCLFDLDSVVGVI